MLDEAPMTRWDLALLAVDYLRLRQQQLRREPSPWEVRGIRGFVDYLVMLQRAVEANGHERA